MLVASGARRHRGLYWAGAGGYFPQLDRVPPLCWGRPWASQVSRGQGRWEVREGKRRSAVAEHSHQARARGPSAEPAPLRRGPLPGRFGRRALPQALLSLLSGNPLLPAWQSPCRWLSTELGAELCQEAASRPSYPVRLLHRGMCQAAPPLGYRRLAGIGLPASSGKERPWNARSLKHFAQSPALSFHD